VPGSLELSGKVKNLKLRRKIMEVTLYFKVEEDLKGKLDVSLDIYSTCILEAITDFIEDNELVDSVDDLEERITIQRFEEDEFNELLINAGQDQLETSWSELAFLYNNYSDELVSAWLSYFVKDSSSFRYIEKSYFIDNLVGEFNSERDFAETKAIENEVITRQNLEYLEWEIYLKDLTSDYTILDLPRGGIVVFTA